MALQHSYIPAPPESEGARKTQGIGVQRFYEVLAENHPGYEHRQEQYDLTQAIAGRLAAGGHLAAQAPTGTGKSFAVGGAVIAAFLGTGKKTVIATANNNLLEQYATKDLPFLQQLFPDLKWARAKGKNNYACIEKGEKIFGQQSLFDKSQELKKLQGWYDSTISGDKQEISFHVPEEDWSKINADDSCTGKKCAFYEDCHYFKAKAATRKADIIITNFDLVLLDLLNPMVELFPAYNALILDEAHQLEDKAISKLEVSLTRQQVASYLDKAHKSYGLEDQGTRAFISDAAANLFTNFSAVLQDGKEKQIIIPDHALRTAVTAFQNAMGGLEKEIWKHRTTEGSRDRKLQENLIDKVRAASHAALTAITNDPRSVSWVEQTRTDIKIVTCPFRVGKALYDALFANESVSVICLSATLGIKTSNAVQMDGFGNLKRVVMFEQFRQRIGMVNCGEFDCPSPFNYPQNAVLYLPRPPAEVDNPNKPGYINWMLDQVQQLVELSRGRALILTTSNKALRDIAGHLTRNSSLQVKMQAPGTSNTALINWFKETENAVLVGTSSFWEGVSIEGELLKLVIIDKIPFASHTEPIQQARSTWYKSDPEKKKKEFMDLQVYPACIKLMQGFGRLIRTKSDTGVVAILDPRLTVGRNKQTFINSLPKAYTTSLINDPRLIEKLR